MKEKWEGDMTSLKCQLSGIKGELKRLRERNGELLAEVVQLKQRLLTTNDMFFEALASVNQLRLAIEFVLYYVEGDATYEGVVEKLKTQYGYEANKK